MSSFDPGPLTGTDPHLYQDLDRIPYFRRRDGRSSYRDEITRVTFVVCAVGTIGQAVISQLLAVGARRFVLIDLPTETLDMHNRLKSPLVTYADCREGKLKLRAVARTLTNYGPGYRPTVLGHDVRTMPPGILRRALEDQAPEGDPRAPVTMISGFDNFEASAAAHALARHLDRVVCHVDAKVDGIRSTGSYQIFEPGRTEACYECSLREPEYAQYALRSPCQPPRGPGGPSSPVPGTIAAFVAASVVHDILGVLAGEETIAGRRVFLDLRVPIRVLDTRLERRWDCGRDHARIGSGPPQVVGESLRRMRVGDLLERAGSLVGPDPEFSFYHDVALEAICVDCHAVASPGPAILLETGARRCRCAGPRRWLSPRRFLPRKSTGSDLAPYEASTLEAFGIRPGDHVEVLGPRGRAVMELWPEGRVRRRRS